MSAPAKTNVGTARSTQLCEPATRADGSFCKEKLPSTRPSMPESPSAKTACDDGFAQRHREPVDQDMDGEVDAATDAQSRADEREPGQRPLADFLNPEEPDGGQIEGRRDPRHHVAEKHADEHVHDDDDHQDGDEDFRDRTEPRQSPAHGARMVKLPRLAVKPRTREDGSCADDCWGRRWRFWWWRSRCR